MEFSWTAETQALIERFERLGAALATSPSAAPGFDRTGWDACSRDGIFSPFCGLAHDRVPAADPGSPASLRGAVAVFEALGRGGARRDLLFALGAHLYGCQVPLCLHGDAAQRERWLGGLAQGSLIGALAVTEPHGGSNPSAMQTRTEARDGGFVLSGLKTLVTNAPIADLFLVVAATRPERGSFGWTAFLVPADTPGIEVRPLDSIGLTGAPMGEVQFKACPLSAGQVLGTPDGGLRVFTSAMLWERTGILAGFVAAGLRDLDAAVAYANGRRMGNEPLSAKQSISHRLAAARLRLERSRLLILRAAWAVDTGQKNVQSMVAMAKHDAAESVVETALDLMRIGAGASWCGAMGTADALKDCLGTLSASGTAEVQLDIVAAAMGLKRR